MANVRRVGLEVCTRVNVVRYERKKSVSRGIFGVRFRVRSFLDVGNMCVTEGVMRVNVVIARYRGDERARVGNGFMKEWRVMLWCRRVVGLVIRNCNVGSIVVRIGVTMGSVLKLVELLLRSYVNVGA